MSIYHNSKHIADVSRNLIIDVDIITTPIRQLVEVDIRDVMTIPVNIMAKAVYRRVYNFGGSKYIYPLNSGVIEELENQKYFVRRNAKYYPRFEDEDWRKTNDIEPCDED